MIFYHLESEYNVNYNIQQYFTTFLQSQIPAVSASWEAGSIRITHAECSAKIRIAVEFATPTS